MENQKRMTREEIKEEIQSHEEHLLNPTPQASERVFRQQMLASALVAGDYEGSSEATIAEDKQWLEDKYLHLSVFTSEFELPEELSREKFDEWYSPFAKKIRDNGYTGDINTKEAAEMFVEGWDPGAAADLYCENARESAE